ncbi:MAG: hypothetical protein OEU46_09275 [Alphaproteobacteria bacterium]|nr:hypothetical protein [Alphaproteobacteria bacterium]
MEVRNREDIQGYEATSRERLTELAGFLDEVPADRLTFARWYAQGKGCAVGLAAAHNPWFQAQGFRLEYDSLNENCWPTFDGHSDRAAVAKFFGLSLTEMRRLLGPDGYAGKVEPHPRMVAQNIRSFLAESISV